MSGTGAHAGPLARLRRLPELGFPQRYPLVQFPNGPLAVALIAGIVTDQTRHDLHAYARSLAYLALALWAWQELTAGVNLFRRLLGLVFLAMVLVDIASAIN